MYRILITCMLLSLAFNLFGQTISLSGKVKNQDGNGINGAIVTLASNEDLTTTTSAEGAYTLAGDITGVSTIAVLPGRQIVSLRNGIISARLNKPARVRIEMFDMRGNLLDNVLQRSAVSGVFQFNIMKSRFAANMMIIRVSIGQHSTTLRFLPVINIQNASTNVSSTGRNFAKRQASIDELKVTAAGYVSKTVPISSYEGTVDITLELEDLGECTQSKPAGSASGSGPHDVVIETNSDRGINKGTIFRPADLGDEKYPIFLWGEGGCSQNGLSNKAAMGEIASWGYFIIADGTPGSGGAMGKASSSGMGDPSQFYGYLDWIFAENKKPCSAYYQSVDTTKVAADGFSCGGLMSINASGDPRFTAIGYTSSGLFDRDQNIYNNIHTPIKIMNGGDGGDMAYPNGLADYEAMSTMDIPIIYFVKKNAGHGGDLGNGKGDFNTVNLAWLNWQLKGDEGATGKALLTGPDCRFCNDSGWEFKTANFN